MELRVKMKIASLISQILHLLTCVRKKVYRLGMEMKMKNAGRGSVKKRQEERESKKRSSLDEIQHL